MKIVAIVLATVLLAALPAKADEEARQIVSELLDHSGFKENVVGLQEGLKSNILNAVQSHCLDTDANKNVLHIIKKYIPYEEMREPMIDLYLEAFTKDELKQILEFNKSDLGQKMMKELPNIMNEGFAVGQNKVQNSMQLIQLEVEGVVSNYINDDGTCK